jgi:multidrug transporter EmrE-like cation transporter
MELVLLFIVIAISLCELMGQSCLKYFNTKDSKIHYYLLAIMFYAMVCYLLIQSYKYKGMGLVNVLWSGISILVILSGSAIFFGEEITTMDKVGVVMVILGIILIMYEENPHLPPFNKK